MEFDKVLEQVYKYERKMKGESIDIVNRISKVIDYLSKPNSFSFDLRLPWKSGELDNIDVADFLIEYVFKDIVKTSRIGLYNKTSNRTEKKLICEFYQVDMAGERHEGYYYKFEDGRLFYTRIIGI
jgi:hypothetical protein